MSGDLYTCVDVYGDRLNLISAGRDVVIEIAPEGANPADRDGVALTPDQQLDLIIAIGGHLKTVGGH
ncbi:hypothetical protein SEA_REINDEER_135 [Mycobacterium phage Reindeer]|uniref:Uncharacterized protein n=1 Tax=Mycobacterium phage Reindeer TaxID=2762283 RepID=A0A7G8LI54_9CAUD|nr:hypothetical protein J4U05_gp117 [Mycobacterium phage Reindeer]QNJ56926.1 hypothetical protein SEA_REINDEER_135 [Mycobacterium phage Reindeer]